MFVDATVGRRIEKAFAQCARTYAVDHRALFPEHGAEVLEVGGDGGGVAVWGTIYGAPSVSRAYALGLDGAVDAAALSRVEDFFARHETPVTVLASPWTHPSLLALLAERRYRLASLDNVLVRSIEPGESPAPPATGDSIVVARGDALRWGRIVRVGFGVEEDMPSGIGDAIFEGSKTAACFIATVAGEPAGGGAVVIASGTAYLVGTATLPAFRGRGVHRALVEARLAHVRAAGIDLAFVITTPGSGSQRNLELRCGFRVAYAQAVFTQPARSAVEPP